MKKISKKLNKPLLNIKLKMNSKKRIEPIIDSLGYLEKKFITRFIIP